MSKQYPGGIISKTAPVPSGPYANSTAPGVWTLEQQAYWQKLGQWPTQGNVSPSAFIENLFSTYLYTGTGAAQTITNGMNLSGSGGLVWSKSRNIVQDNSLIDTVRGNGSILYSNIAGAADTGVTTGITAFGTTGYSLGSGSFINQSSQPYVSWTFQEQAKFFDIVTWTGNGIAGRQIPHNLGSVPGCIIVKNIELGTNWTVYHRGADATAPQDYEFYLDATNARISSIAWNNTAPTSTYFTVGSGNAVNRASSLNTYVAYLFAHDAGGFGLTGTDNVITCGSFTTDGSGNATVNLGYEPQWLLTKNAGGGNWRAIDIMRGMSQTDAAILFPNITSAESLNVGSNLTAPTATGFNSVGNNASANYIYVAIRRGPMAVPTLGTNVYNGIAYTGNDASNRQVTGLGFPPDLALVKARNQTRNYGWEDRLRGADKWLVSSGTDSEGSFSDFGAGGPLLQNGITIGANGLTNEAPNPYILQAMRRAPGFFDETCYSGNSASSGTGNTQLISHNLTVAPEMIIVKRRSGGSDWVIWTSALSATQYMFFDAGAVLSANPTYFFGTTGPTPSATQFKVGDAYYTNATGSTYAAWLFATCPGVSKVGSYTGTATLTTINCGFTSGARFVLIKRTDGSGSWYVWDTTRGMVSGTDPSLQLSFTSGEVAGDSVYTVSTGFQIVASPAVDINSSGGSYIFLAIA